MRIASLQPSITVTLRDLGQLDALVACTKYCADVCPEVREREIHIIQDSWTAKADEITAVSPDVVIASVPYQMEAVAEILKSGTRFLGLAPKCLNDIYGDIRTIARLVGVEQQGETLVREMQNAIDEVRRNVEPLPKMRVFSEEWGKPIIHSQKWVAELVEAAGGEFTGEPGKQTTAEEIRERDPEVILAAWCGAGERVPLEKIVRDRNWSETTAAKTGKVFCIADELLNTPASTLIGGLNAIAWALHPNYFRKPSGIRAMQPM
jgi:iron complex transport system substrate-binding protein